MLFYRPDLELDVFIGKFIQCHELNLEKGLLKCKNTISPACLLLTKLQIVQINHKDILDILAILIDHPVEKNDDCFSINIDEIVDITKEDWGWYTTVSDNLEKTISMARDIFDVETAGEIYIKVSKIKKAIVYGYHGLKLFVKNIKTMGCRQPHGFTFYYRTDFQ
jgi:hypothetical protein